MFRKRRREEETIIEDHDTETELTSELEKYIQTCVAAELDGLLFIMETHLTRKNRLILYTNS